MCPYVIYQSDQRKVCYPSVLLFLCQLFIYTSICPSPSIPNPILSLNLSLPPPPSFLPPLFISLPQSLSRSLYVCLSVCLPPHPLLSLSLPAQYLKNLQLDSLSLSPTQSHTLRICSRTSVHIRLEIASNTSSSTSSSMRILSASDFLPCCTSSILTDLWSWRHSTKSPGAIRYSGWMADTHAPWHLVTPTWRGVNFSFINGTLRSPQIFFNKKRGNCLVSFTEKYLSTDWHRKRKKKT